jgi:hypothetical protein
LWILSGSNDVGFTSYFAKNMLNYSDDGKTSWGAYGWRLRSFFGYDQIDAVIEELKTNSESRRCVLGMWNAADNPALPQWLKWCRNSSADMIVAINGGKDVPCNTQIYVDARGGRLNITVTNRSNDIIWGCYGANAVHFSFLQEYLAMRVGILAGVYRQFSNNFHCYLDKFSREKLKQIAQESDTLGKLPDTGPALEPGFDDDLALFMPWARALIRHESNVIPSHGSAEPGALELEIPTLKTRFMADVAVPMFLAWYYRKQHDEFSMNVCLDGIDAPDWQRACQEWVDRRKK